MISKSTEEYLKTIYVLYKQNNEIRVTDIAQRMNCSKPSVTKQLNILSENKLIIYETYGKIELTDKGIELAKEILANYDIIYILLNDVIGINSELAKIEANKIKSVVSNETLNEISKYINNNFGLHKSNCNFDVRKEKCRNCVINRKELV
ncbi:MAG: metal-dependent transcriptional regulator [Bacilli bacterium]|nr:metal-dependent transcriptional regulator [Bacilli bacterium]